MNKVARWLESEKGTLWSRSTHFSIGSEIARIKEDSLLRKDGVSPLWGGDMYICTYGNDVNGLVPCYWGRIGKQVMFLEPVEGAHP